jgi:hypothetical protein
MGLCHFVNFKFGAQSWGQFLIVTTLDLFAERPLDLKLDQI